jgi:hypothetical protein
MSDQTIMALAGRVSKAMLARYSHIRLAAKRAAIDALEVGNTAARIFDFEPGYSQKSSHRRLLRQSPNPRHPEKLLN